ncbi:Uncharacterized protein PCOAH_00005120 [Plasmodium coatneyi]|uniref:Amine oxidase domain-containing protein n=1 Tax=Plasmodium coatneyi TaxID=208452 RepID=A0A1B1DU12_9APIC|nr:Uncharacterized protein PCOAH_00005120 [Plasmodium coatneyi]ANQ06242.1 Uncharacterized protein PCOAH_00005120 [Plasmodium coatneyi]
MSLLKDSELEEVHRKIIDGTIEKCSQFYNTRILEAIKLRWLKIYERKLQVTERGSNQSGVPQQKGAPNVTDDFEDDEFEDAEVEEKEIVELEEHVQDDEADELNELDEISISDLSDVDPPTSNVIVGICDKITKPCGRRNASSNWKIKLKGGLMKVEGKEMFFRSLQGELEPFCFPSPMASSPGRARLMAKASKSICIVGGGVDSLCLALYLSKNKHHVKLLNVKRKCSLIDSAYFNHNVIEVGRHYTFPLGGPASRFNELLRWVTAEDEVILSNPYANNLSYLDEFGRIYRVNKFILKILFYLLKDHLFGSSIPNPKDERMDSFLSKRFDANLFESVIRPYCFHYFGYSPRDVLMRSHFPNFMDRMGKEKSLIKALRTIAKKGSSPIFAQKKKIGKFAKGNITLVNKLRDHLELCSNVQVITPRGDLQIRCMRRGVKVRLGRKSIKCEQIIFCLSPPELKDLLRNVTFEEKKKDALVKKYLSKFRSHAVRISNVCFAKNVLPFSHSLESLLLFKRNKQNKLISLLYDRNIFPPQCDEPSGLDEDHPGEPSPEGGLYETSLRFMSRETDERKSVEEINAFLRGVLGVQEKPDMLISHVHRVFPFDARADQAYKKIISRKSQRVRLFWTFYFFRSFEFCLEEAKRFSDSV